ncbi:Hypp7904 [Branchiostoma lanceolatum]|uniref:Hypp7904 protein n=1 Tax=Branchiostoma lanceolatum TaxID=7740 RepID=A0A8J9Z497_BRALA|nr:Hypp7904 [Branchiostoma lanceolatum]
MSRSSPRPRGRAPPWETRTTTLTVVNPLHPDQPMHDESFLASAPGTCSAVVTVVNPLHPDQPLHDESFLASAPGTCSAVGDPHYHTDGSETAASRPASPRRVVPHLGSGHVFGRGRPALPHVPNCLFHSTVTVVKPQHPDQPLHDESFLASAPGTCSAVGDPHYHTFLTVSSILQ